MISPITMWVLLGVGAVCVLLAMIASQFFPSSPWPPVVALFGGLLLAALTVYVAGSILFTFFRRSSERNEAQAIWDRMERERKARKLSNQSVRVRWR